MNFKNFLNEAIRLRRVKISNGVVGPYMGKTGTMVFSKVLDNDLRYYVIELDLPVKGIDVIIVYNGDFDFV